LAAGGSARAGSSIWTILKTLFGPPSRATHEIMGKGMICTLIYMLLPGLRTQYSNGSSISISAVGVGRRSGHSSSASRIPWNKSFLDGPSAVGVSAIAHEAIAVDRTVAYTEFRCPKLKRKKPDDSNV